MPWTLISILFLVVFIVLSIIFGKKYTKFNEHFNQTSNQVMYNFNPLVIENYEAGNINKIYRNIQPSKSFIDKYMISYDDGKPFLLCNFVQLEEQPLNITIYGYDKKKNINTVFEVDDVDAFKNTNSLPLSKTIVNVNFNLVYEKAEDEEDSDISEKVFYSDKKNPIKKLVAFESLTFLFLLIPVGYFLLYYLAGTLIDLYMTAGTLLLGFALIFTISIANFSLIVLWFTKNNHKRGIANE